MHSQPCGECRRRECTHRLVVNAGGSTLTTLWRMQDKGVWKPIASHNNNTSSYSFSHVSLKSYFLLFLQCTVMRFFKKNSSCVPLTLKTKFNLIQASNFLRKPSLCVLLYRWEVVRICQRIVMYYKTFFCPFALRGE